jgi:ribosomal protein S18 acetylase RimI-like enzyme
LTVYGVLRRGRGGVVDQVTRVADPVEGEGGPTLRDARVLRKAMRESILTSPGSFLRTVADVDNMGGDYWDKEIGTYTWVVVQQLDKVVGIAVARWPDQAIDHDIDPNKVRFIESVWIAPEFRGSRMGERLVKYLIEVECDRYPNVKNFMLWVFEDNKRAIRLYVRMQFKYKGKQPLSGQSDRFELRYQYVLPHRSGKRAARRVVVNAAAREDDLRRYGVTYRTLGADTS